MWKDDDTVKNEERNYTCIVALPFKRLSQKQQAEIDWKREKKLAARRHNAKSAEASPYAAASTAVQIDAENTEAVMIKKALRQFFENALIHLQLAAVEGALHRMLSAQPRNHVNRLTGKPRSLSCPVLLNVAELSVIIRG